MKVFVLDISKCEGCYCCQIACKDEHCGNDWTPYAKPQPEIGQFWLKVNQLVRGSKPKIKLTYIPVMCMHCANAPCIEACPTEGAIYTREDGLVIIDPAKCSGCRQCISACPYGVIYFNSPYNIAQKCTGCAHLLDRGWPITEPRCANSCGTTALLFGEESGFSAEIAQSERLSPNFGDTPNTRAYYLNLPKKFIAGSVYDSTKDEIIEGATCTLSGDSNATTTTDYFGDFWFEGLGVGTYTVKVEAGGKSVTKTDISTEKDVNLGDIDLA